MIHSGTLEDIAAAIKEVTDGDACGGDIDISELKAKMPSDQLDEVITTSGKKSPVQKKLFTRLHFELRYPLNDKQAKKIKVKPHAEEGVP